MLDSCKQYFSFAETYNAIWKRDTEVFMNIHK